MCVPPSSALRTGARFLDPAERRKGAAVEGPPRRHAGCRPVLPKMGNRSENGVSPRGDPAQPGMVPITACGPGRVRRSGTVPEGSRPSGDRPGPRCGARRPGHTEPIARAGESSVAATAPRPPAARSWGTFARRSGPEHFRAVRNGPEGQGGARSNSETVRSGPERRGGVRHLSGRRPESGFFARPGLPDLRAAGPRLSVSPAHPGRRCAGVPRASSGRADAACPPGSDRPGRDGD